MRLGRDLWSFVPMRPVPRSLAAVALAAALACSKKPEPAPAPPPPAFTLRDLAAATALDARLARLSLIAADVEADLFAVAARPPGAKPAARAPDPAKAPPAADGGLKVSRVRLLDLEDSRVAADVALAQITHAQDREGARAAVAAATAWVRGLEAAAAHPDPGVDLFAARDQAGAAIAAYRRARAAWRLDAPEPQGLERTFAGARREMELVEAAFGSRTKVAPREQGHEFDPVAARMTAQMAAQRAKVAAEGLPAPLRAPALRYAVAEANALDAMKALTDAPEGGRPAAARAYHAAKAEALAALADYFAALAAR